VEGGEWRVESGEWRVEVGGNGWSSPLGGQQAHLPITTDPPTASAATSRSLNPPQPASGPPAPRQSNLLITSLGTLNLSSSGAPDGRGSRYRPPGLNPQSLSSVSLLSRKRNFDDPTDQLSLLGAGAGEVL